MRPTRRKPDASSERGPANPEPASLGPSRPVTAGRRGSTPARVMRRFISERKGLFAGNLALRLVKDLLPFVGPVLVGIAVDLLSGTDRSLFGMSLTTNEVRSIVIVAIAMGVLAVAKAVVGFSHTLVAAHMGRHIVEAARRDVAEAAMQMSLDRRRTFNSGDLLDRSLADTKGLRSFTQNVVIRIISNTVRAVVPLYMMFAIDPIMALVVLAVIPLQSGFSGLLQRRLQRETRHARSREAAHTSAVKEAIDGWSSVASVSGQERVTAELRTSAAASEQAKIIKKKTTASISAVINLCTSFGIAACYAIGGWRIIESGALDGTGEVAAGALTLGTLTTFIGVAGKTYAPFRAYTNIVSDYRTGLVNLERISEVLDAPMVDPRRDGPELEVTKGEITLTGVSFSYSDGDVPTLRHLTGVIPGQALTVITGSSGAGKTTLLRLLMGLDVPDTGSVRIDGQDINVARLASVQRAMALVPQEPMLFTGTFAENVLLGNADATTEDLLAACHLAGLIDFVRSLPDGFDTEVGSGRHVLSGGQLRRMAIARALLRRPAILLLDEPTEGLDDETSALVLATLRAIGKHATVVMVSHRRGPRDSSDHHLILHDGMWTEGVVGLDDDEWVLFPDGDLDERELFEPPPEITVAQVTPNGPTAVTNGTSNGTAANGEAANGHDEPKGHPAQARFEERVVGLSAMGRPITARSVSIDGVDTHVTIVGGHRCDAIKPRDVLPHVLESLAVQEGVEPAHVLPRLGVEVSSLPDVSPDSAWIAGHRTVLGADLASDHGQLMSVETSVLHAALDRFGTDVVIDVAHRPAPLPTDAAVDVVIRYAPEADGSRPESVARYALQLRSRLEAVQVRSRVALAPAAPGSLTEVRGVPVVELTAAPEGHAIVAATVAAVQAIATAGSALSAGLPG